MYHPDDKELDRLSAAAAEHYQPPGNPSWDALEQTLDVEMPQKKKRRRGLFWFFLLPALFFAGAIYWYARPAATTIATTTSKPNNTNQPYSDKTGPAASAANANTGSYAPAPAQEPVSMPNSVKAAAAPVKTIDNNSLRNNKKAAPDAAYQPAPLTVFNKKRPAPGSNTGHNTFIAANKRSTAGPAKNPVTDAAGNTDNNNSNTTVDAANTAAADKKDLAQTDLPSNTNTTPPAAANTPAADTAAAAKPVAAPVPDKPAIAQTADKQKKKTGKDRAFSIGITGGVDMSTVKFDYGSNTGYNIGLTAGYYFNKNWSIHTGAVYTKKNYKMDGDNYHAPAGTWLSYYNIDMVNGNCQMWEVPLTGRYTFNSRTNNRLFVGAGLSSYFMTHEQYNYSYKRQGTPMTADWTNDKDSRYLFSILNLSAGIEKPLGRHIVGQLEPYAKLPLAGVGAGKIKLSSFGLNVTLQYKKKIGK